MALLSIGCGSSKHIMNNVPPPATSETAVTKSVVQDTAELQPLISKLDTVIFDPLELGDDGILVPRTEEKSTASEETQSNLAIIPMDKAKVSTTIDTAEAEEEVEKPGYRVQIYASTQVELARNMERKAKEQFPLGVYLIYDPPNYKIRIGDCENRVEAEGLLMKAKELGYNDAWVVKDKVKSKVKA
jgi:hypothetical protein